MNKPWKVLAVGNNEVDLPPCYSSLADAMSEYLEAKEIGFDGGLNEFLAMRHGEIDDGNDEAIADHALERLFARNRYSIVEKVCKKWLDEVRR